MELAVVFRTFNPAEADLMKARLDAAGIEASVEHALAGTTATGWTVGAGGIDVMVRADQAEDARNLLESSP